MPGNRGINKSFYHFQVDFIEDGIVKSSKFHYTIKEMEKEYSTSNCCLYNLLSKPGHIPRAAHLKKLKFYRVKKPTQVLVEVASSVSY